MRLNVLAILPVSIGGRLTTSSIIDGFRQNGINTTVFDELYDTNFNAKIHYDLIVGYDFSPLRFKLCNNLSAKCICYFSDEIYSKAAGPDWQELQKDLYRKDVFTFFWDEAMLSQYDFKNIYYLPHFVNFDLYKPCHKDKFDVMFAGRLDTDYRLNLFTELMKALPEYKFAWYAIKRHYDDAMTRTKYPKLIETAYQGFIDNEEDMAKAINSSKILFNINSQGISSLNYRTFQAVACKRIIISDNREELKLFKGNMPSWENFDDLVNKIHHYINSPKDYEQTVDSCWEFGRKNHHSKENIEFMLKKVLVPNT